MNTNQVTNNYQNQLSKLLAN